MKKIARQLIPFCCAALMLLCLAACGKPAEPSAAAPTTAPTAAPTSAPTAAPTVKAEPSEAVKALNERAAAYQAEMAASGKVTKETDANWYTMNLSGLIREFIPSFLRTDMSLFEIQKGELVYVGPAVADPENLCVKTAEPLVPLAVADHPEYYEAVLSMAYAYYYQGPQLYYDQYNVRRNVNVLPNDSTADVNRYLDCSSYANSVYYNTMLTAKGTGDNITASVNTKTFMAECAGGFQKADQPQVVAYFKRSPKDADLWSGGIGENEGRSGEEMLEILKSALQPGDVLVTRRGANNTAENGHAMIYVGDGWILHSTGGSIASKATPEAVMGYKTQFNDNSATSADTPVTGEMANGTIYKTDCRFLFDRDTLGKDCGISGTNRRFLLYDGKMFGDSRDAASSTILEIGILRPIARTDYVDLSAQGQAVLAYPDVTVEKRLLVNGKSVYDRTVLPGDTLTVEITVENHGNRRYTDVPVLNEGTAWDSITLEPAGTPGAVQVLTKETALASGTAAGRTYLSGRAEAGGILSNKVPYVIGSRGEAARKALLEPALTTDLSAEKTAYNAALALYKAAFGEEILKDFTEESLTEIKADKHSNLIFSEKLPIVGTLQGGYNLHANMDLLLDGVDYVRRVRPEYLEAGDLIVVASGTSRNLSIQEIYLFMDESTLYRFSETAEGVKMEKAYTDAKTVTAFLTALYCQKGFMVLRPEA